VAAIHLPSQYCVPLPLGNGKCGCNGNCTCNEGFSGDICECRPIEECRRNPGDAEVSSPSFSPHMQFFKLCKMHTDTTCPLHFTLNITCPLPFTLNITCPLPFTSVDITCHFPSLTLMSPVHFPFEQLHCHCYFPLSAALLWFWKLSVWYVHL